MRLRELYDILKNVELKQIIVGEQEEQIISLMNTAIIEVYGKFSILQEEHIINIVDGVTRYRLPEHTQRVVQVYVRNTSTEPLKGKDAFKEIPLNDINCDNSVFTPQPYILHVPNPDEGKVYSVISIVSPPYITKDNINTLDFVVPDQYMEPIVEYVAYRAYKSMNGSEQTEIATHYASYNRACDNIRKKGLAQDNMMTNMKLTERGYK